MMQKATGHYIAVKENVLRDIVTDHEWLDLLRRVVSPVREEIIEAQKIPLSDIPELKVESQRKLPKLSMLISLICFDIPMYDNLPLVLSAICETILSSLVDHVDSLHLHLTRDIPENLKYQLTTT